MSLDFLCEMCKVLQTEKFGHFNINNFFKRTVAKFVQCVNLSCINKQNGIEDRNW